MNKRTTVILLVAAAAAVGLVLWMRRQQAAVVAVGVPTTTVTPTQIAPQAVVANSVAGLVQVGANWVAQWFTDKVSTPQQHAVPYKPPPIATKPATTATPISNTPAVVTTPGAYFA